jgi:pimeloyl-ACP methyl ester carboxylesterase
VSSVKANGMVIEFDSFGAEDAEPILLISGLGVQMVRWSVPFCEALASNGYRIIRFDNRDVGLSTHLDGGSVPELGFLAQALGRGERPPVPYSLLDMAGDAVALLDALGVKRAHVVGRSMGGMIAQLMASEHPSRVLTLTSIMSSTGNPNLPGPSAEAMGALTRGGPTPTDHEEGYLDQSVASARVIASPGFRFDESAQRARAFAEVKRAYNPAGFARQLAAMITAGDRRARLNTIKVPTLVIHGAEDLLIPLAGGEDTADNIKDARLVVIDGMGHDLPSELHQRFVQAIITNARRSRETPPLLPGAC